MLPTNFFAALLISSSMRKTSIMDTLYFHCVPACDVLPRPPLRDRLCGIIRWCDLSQFQCPAVFLVQASQLLHTLCCIAHAHNQKSFKQTILRLRHSRGTPVANGSSVPVCPTLKGNRNVAFLNLLHTSNEVHLFGLSTKTIAFLQTERSKTGTGALASSPGMMN